MSRRAVRAVPGVAAILAIACSLDSSGKNACRTSSDCLGGDVCHLNVCRNPGELSDASAGGQDGNGGRGAGGTPVIGGTGPGTGGSSGGASGAGGLDLPAGGTGGDGQPPEAGAGSAAANGGAGQGGSGGGNAGCRDGLALRVDVRSTAATPNGATWAGAYADLQEALAEASARVEAGCVGVELWVAEGRLVPSSTGNRAASFRVGPGIALYGGFAGNETARSERRPQERRTILSGDLAGNDASGPAGLTENSLHVVRAVALNATSVMDGFEIRGGNGDTLGSWGAGIVHEGGDGTYRNLVVTGNTSSGTGAGCMILSGAPTLESVYFLGNRSAQGGSALQSASSPILRDVVVAANTGGGAAITFAGGGNPQLERVILAGNEGGALHLASGALTTASSLVIAGNRADFWPGLLLGTNIDVIHATLAFNHSTGPIGAALGIASGASGARVRNSIFWGNTPVDVDAEDHDSVASSVFPGAAGGDNLDVDPRFESPVSGGTWTATPRFEPGRSQTHLVDASASLPADLAGAFVQVKSGDEGDPRLALVAENDAKGMWVWGDVTRWTAMGEAYTIRRVTLAADSPAVDTADAAHSTDTDAAAAARYDVPGRGTSKPDRGAYEWSP